MPLIDIARPRRLCARVLPLGRLVLSAEKTSAAGAPCLMIQPRGARESMVPQRAVLDATYLRAPPSHRRSMGHPTRLEFA